MYKLAALLVLGTALLLSAVPAQGTFYGSSHQKEAAHSAPKTWYFPKIEFSKKVSKYTKDCPVAKGLSALQPGCTHEYNFYYYWGKQTISVCAACFQPNYTYVFSTGQIPVCQCSKDYARNSTGFCIWKAPTPAPPPYKPKPNPTPYPWHGGYGWPHPTPNPHPFPPVPPKDPHYGFYDLCKKLYYNKDKLFDKLFGKIHAAGR